MASQQKCKSMASPAGSSAKKQRKVIDIEIKIIKEYEAGKKVQAIVSSMGWCIRQSQLSLKIKLKIELRKKKKEQKYCSAKEVNYKGGNKCVVLSKIQGFIGTRGHGSQC